MYPRIVSIQVGQVATHGHDDDAEPLQKTWTSAFFKSPVAGPVYVGRTNLVGDQQADLVYHGGPNKAVLAYSADHYDFWRRELDRPELCFGGFGENLTIAGLDERS